MFISEKEYLKLVDIIELQNKQICELIKIATDAQKIAEDAIRSRRELVMKVSKGFSTMRKELDEINKIKNEIES